MYRDYLCSSMHDICDSAILFLCYCSNNEKYRSALCSDRCCTRCWSLCCYQPYRLWLSWYELTPLFFYSTGISQDLCETRGCCYADGASPSCFYPESGQVNITKVHIVHGCHFDAGFVDDLYIIINRYFDTFFPAIHDVFQIESKWFVFRKVWEERLRAIILWSSLLTLTWFICSSTVLLTLSFIAPMRYVFWRVIDGLESSGDDEGEYWEWVHHMAFFPSCPWIRGYGQVRAYWFESSWSRSLIQFGIQMSNDLKRRFNKPDSIILNDNDVYFTTAVSWLGPRTNCWFDSYHAREQHSCISLLCLLYW